MKNIIILDTDWKIKLNKKKLYYFFVLNIDIFIFICYNYKNKK